MILRSLVANEQEAKLAGSSCLSMCVMMPMYDNHALANGKPTAMQQMLVSETRKAHGVDVMQSAYGNGHAAAQSRSTTYRPLAT